MEAICKSLQKCKELRAPLPADRRRLFAVASNFLFVSIGNRMLTIAVVEDDPSMLQGLNRLLLAHGYRVEKFTSAESFLGDVARCEAKCLLVDIHLCGM